MRTKISFFAIFLLTLIACEQELHGPLVTKGGKPNILTNIRVENLNGGAILSYTLPDDPDLLYVLAEYSMGNDVKRKVIASVFDNSMLLEGFSTTDEKEVTLYTVDRSENRSDPIVVKVKPLTSPLEVTFGSLQVKEDFGGVNLNFSNITESDIVLYTLIQNELQQWIIYDRLYTSAKERDYSVRGLANEPLEFGFVFQDKWQNKSDTLFTTLTPLYEEKLDKKLWKHYLLDNDDYTQLYADRALKNLWDDSNKNWMLGNYDGIALPNWFTIDLGQTAILSRMKMFPVSASTSNYQWMYSTGTPRVFEIWGSNNPSLDGSWDSWTLIEHFESIKPSGLPIGINSPEDIAVGLAGEDHTFTNFDNAYRYIRFKVIDTWGKNPQLMLEEITFWGQPA